MNESNTPEPGAAPAESTALSESDVMAARLRLLAKGLSHVNPSGTFAFGPRGMEAYGAASIALLLKEGKTLEQIAQVGDIDPSAVREFAALPHIADMINAWKEAFK